jgi:flagellar basal-body rod modification protein FlgD
MSTISPISNNPLAATEESRASVARSALTDNMDTFLKLLTKQLQNQDPMQPMDTNQFVDQLTQFSELEQGVEQSALLEKIANGVGGSDRQADIGLLGRVVEAESDILPYDPQNGVRFAYEITAPVEEAEMRIFDESGTLVASFEVDGKLGRYGAAWDGTMDAGGKAPAGLYQAQLVTTSEEGTEALAGKILSGGTVREVRFEDGDTKLILDQGMTIGTDAITRVALPAAA